MREHLIQYVNLLFAGAQDCADTQQEILQNLLRIHLYVLRGKWDFKHSPLEEKKNRSESRERRSKKTNGT